MADYGICELSVVPVRKQPSDKSEMINQLLFGDLLIIEESQGNWYLIRTSHDNYEGWTDSKQVTIIGKEEYIEIGKSETYYINTISNYVTDNNYRKLSIVLGSKLPNYNNGSFSFEEKNYSINNNTVTKTMDPDLSILETAKKYLGAPYLWGGRSPYGIDCSGYVQLVFGMHGISLPRDAYLQVESGSTIDFIDEAKTGDLAYFDNEEQQIIHVGILLDNKKIIHASGEVRIDNIDHQGIYNEQLKKYTHKLRIIKRILD